MVTIWETLWNRCKDWKGEDAFRLRLQNVNAIRRLFQEKNLIRCLLQPNTYVAIDPCNKKHLYINIRTCLVWYQWSIKKRKCHHFRFECIFRPKTNNRKKSLSLFECLSIAHWGRIVKSIEVLLLWEFWK